MAQNRKSDHDPPQSSDSEEEAEAEASSDEDSDSESEQQQNSNPSPPPPPPQVTKKPSAPKKPESSPSSASSESESESDTPTVKPHKPDPNIKPIASKPMMGKNNHPKPTKKPRSKPTSPLPSKPTSSKRPADTEPTKESKRSKTPTVTDESKKQLFQRLWSEDDEIVILKGMIDYHAKKGTDPVADMEAFHEFIKKSLHVVDVSNTQLLNKVRRLKKKYENNAGKEQKGKKERNFSKTHEKKAYELSKIIWGGVGLNNNSASVVDNSLKVNGSVKKQRGGKVKVEGKKVQEVVPTPIGSNNVENKMEVQNDEGGLGQMGMMSIGDWGSEEEMIKGGLELIKGPKKAELEEKWRKLNVETMELFLKRKELICEQTRLMLQVLKPGN